MKILSLLPPLLFVLAMTSVGWTQQIPSAARQERPKPAPAKLEDFERYLGPLKIKTGSFTVVLRMKRVAGVGAPDPDFQETVARMEIRDEAGKVHYEKSFPYQVRGDRFEETIGISARLLEGTQGTGLLVSYGWLPSTPLGGGSDQVFGMFNDKLVPFGKPLSTEGGLAEPAPRENVVKTTAEPGLQGDVLNFRIWTGNVFVIVPVRVDWMMGQVTPARRCYKMTPRNGQSRCRFRVEAERVPREEELTFVRLFQEPEEGMGTPAHVVVKRDSQVEVLEAEGELQWQEDAEGIGLSLADELWLKVRIDRKEGWVHTQEDFHALGLPQAG